MFTQPFKINKFFTSFLTLSFLLSVSEGHAETLFIKADGNRYKTETMTRFENLKKISGEENKYVSAQALFAIGEMLIDGYGDDSYSNGRSALEHFEKAGELLDVLPKDERYYSNGVSADVLREITKTKLLVIRRLSDFYLQRELGTGSLHVCDHKKVKKAIALQKSILGEQKLWYTSEDHAEAYFQLAQITPKGKRKYFKYLERAAALNHTDAIAALADYSQEKADKLQKARSEVKDNDAEFNKKAFAKFARTQSPQVKKLFLENDSRFSHEQFLSYAVGRLIKEENIRSTERAAALKRKCEGGIMEGYHVVPEAQYTEEALTHQKKIAALASFDVTSLVDLYQEEALNHYKKAARIGNLEVCLEQGDKYYSMEGTDEQKRQYDKLAFYFYSQGAKHNDQESWLGLGRMFEFGRGTEKEDLKAIDCYLTSHALGNYYAGRQLDRLGLNWSDRKPLGLVTFDHLDEEVLEHSSRLLKRAIEKEDN